MRLLCADKLNFYSQLDYFMNQFMNPRRFIFEKTRQDLLCRKMTN